MPPDAPVSIETTEASALARRAWMSRPSPSMRRLAPGCGAGAVTGAVGVPEGSEATTTWSGSSSRRKSPPVTIAATTAARALASRAGRHHDGPGAATRSDSSSAAVGFADARRSCSGSNTGGRTGSGGWVGGVGTGTGAGPVGGDAGRVDGTGTGPGRNGAPTGGAPSGDGGPLSAAADAGGATGGGGRPASAPNGASTENRRSASVDPSGWEGESVTREASRGRTLHGTESEARLLRGSAVGGLGSFGSAETPGGVNSSAEGHP